MLILVGCSDAPVDAGSAASTSSEITNTTNETRDTTTSSGGVAESSSEATRGDESSSTSSVVGSSSGTAETTGGPDASFDVGFDVTEISPNAGHLALNVYMGSYGAPFARGPAESVHDAIFVRSVAVGLEGEGFVAAMTDLPGMGNDFTRAIRTRVAETTGLPPEHVLIATTHSHSAPDFQGLWGGGPSEYRDPVIDEIVGSMSRAWLLREEGSLEVASTTAPNNNRRDWGFTDDSLTLLLARDLQGDLLGTVGVFAAHPTVLGEGNRAISRDWCGGYVDTMEAHTGAPAVFFNGVLGDASPAIPPGEYTDDFERAFAYGALVAYLAHGAMPQAEPIDTTLVVHDAAWNLPVQNALFQLAAAVGLLDYAFSDEGGGKSVDTQAAYIRLGTQLQIVTFPGEPLTRTGLAVKDAMTAPHQAVLGQTGDALGYFILSDEWMTGHNDNYEETVSLHESAGDSAVEVLRALIEQDDF